MNDAERNLQTNLFKNKKMRQFTYKIDKKRLCKIVLRLWHFQIKIKWSFKHIAAPKRVNPIC